ncbi:MAG: flagellar export chaperone FlgN [Phycisphaerae bacterium]
MITETPQITETLAELLEVLDEEIAVLSDRLEQMELLSSAIAHRDDDAMEPVLDQMEQTQSRQQQTDTRLAKVREMLASLTGIPAGELRLWRLVRELPEPASGKIASRRHRLVELSDTLRRSHLRTVLLLAESARFNRLLLETMFPAGEPVTTYDSGGTDHWRPDTGLVDTEG